MFFLLLMVMTASEVFSQETRQMSAEAQALLQCLKEIEGKKTLSGTMANVNWNINEAKWVYQHTGKWPALNCFDYIHHIFSSPGGWMDYSNIKEIYNWYHQGGVVAIMWHWNVPANQSGQYSFYWGTESDKTLFDVRKIFEPESDEYKLMMKDIDIVISFLKPLKERNIPILWRPLHEAGGKWFWWGMDPEACNELWRVMYRRFQDAGLDNLIWVWTQAAAWNMPYSEGYKWYPGDEYVDIVSIDIYNNNSSSNIYNSCYKFLRNYSPDKLVALTECGNVPTISKQWKAGSKWLFFMPWYDYGRTSDPKSEAFKSTDHSYCNADWWTEAFSNDFVLSRSDFRQLMTNIQTVTTEQSPANSERYNLNGQPWTGDQSGVSVINGKKYVTNANY
ncbi:MAG: glycoside hydrolase family 26 protein [Bacteroidaceae bacterium]|nr:glycoside hydrolase family 26 protein [Bacteroidaceae bacterium]